MSIWLGGLAALLLASCRRRPPGRWRAPSAAASSPPPLSRFSQLALFAVVALNMTTGLIQAYVYVRQPGDLISTGYGHAVLAKFLLLMLVIGYRRPTTAAARCRACSGVAAAGESCRARPG